MKKSKFLGPTEMEMVLRKALDELLDWAISNRGTEHEFITCYTYEGGRQPDVILRARALLGEKIPVNYRHLKGKKKA